MTAFAFTGKNLVWLTKKKNAMRVDPGTARLSALPDPYTKTPRRPVDGTRSPLTIPFCAFGEIRVF